MSDVLDLITDIASIVTSVRPSEVMTLKRIEEDFRTIYGHSIPFYSHGFSSLTDLLESYPNHFKFSVADGLLIIRTNVRNNITALIAREKSSKKSKKNFINNGNGNNHALTLFKKHKRKEMTIEKELPGAILKAITEVLDMFPDGIHKSRLLTKFKQHVGYECKFNDYGFADEDDLLRYLSGRVVSLHNNVIKPIKSPNKSLFDILKELLSKRTGYTISCLQDQLFNETDIRIPILMKEIGHVNFVDVIYDGHSRGLLSYDQDLVYSPIERRSLCQSSYPDGVCYIKVISVINPSLFTFEIVANEFLPLRSKLHNDMQHCAPNEPLLSMFKENRHCSLEYDGEWYRVRISNISCDKAAQYVTVHFIDFPIEIEKGIEVSLPTDRLRFVPGECENVPAYVHRGSLAYICNDGGRQWSADSCDTFKELVMDNSCVYQSYIASHMGDYVSIDIVAWTQNGGKVSLFQRLVELGLAQSTLHLI